MQKSAQRANRPPTSGAVTMEPIKFVLAAIVFLLIGVLLGWFGHSYYVASEGGPGGETNVATTTSPEIQSLLDKIAGLETQASVSPDDVDLHTHLGNLYFDLGDAREKLGDRVGATQAYRRSITNYEFVRASRKASPDVLTDLGTMYYRVGEPDSAVAAYEAALKIDPDHKNALMNLGIVRKEALGDNAGALKMWRRYLALYPLGPDADRVRTWVSETSAQ